MNLEALRLLKYAITTAEQGSMRRAARTLHVRESTISRNISALEQRLDIQLFHRNHDGVRLTEEGQVWMGSVRAYYDGLDEALTSTARRNKDHDKLRIGLSAPYGRRFLADIIERFEKVCPDVDVSIQDGSCHKQVTEIRLRKLDVAFMCGDCDARACCSEIVCEEGVVALLPADHSLAEKTALTWSDLSGERLLVPQGADGPLLDPCLIHSILAGERVPVIEHCRACQATVILKVQIGKGFTISGANFARGVSIEGTVWRPIVGPNTVGIIKAVWLESNPKRSALRLLGIARNMASGRGRSSY